MLDSPRTVEKSTRVGDLVTIEPGDSLPDYYTNCTMNKTISMTKLIMPSISFPDSATLYLVSCQNVTITTSFDGSYVCPDKVIVFTCKTNGSVIAWISNEYIGIDGEQLELGSTYPVGHTEPRMINPKTKMFANLTMKEGDRVIESQLHITVSKDIPTANVTCHDVSHGLSSSVQFELPCECNLFCDTCTLSF